jgi:hypothetical protein
MLVKQYFQHAPGDDQMSGGVIQTRYGVVEELETLARTVKKTRKLLEGDS